MPVTKPRIGGTEKELEDQILDKLKSSQEEVDADILDLQLQLNTDDFGKKAIEADRKKEAARLAKKKEATQGAKRPATKKTTKEEQGRGKKTHQEVDE